MAGDAASPGPGRGYLRVARGRGAVSGVLLIALGVWGGAIAFVGPYFHYAYTPATPWAWTAGRLWLEVLPGLAAIVAGFLLLSTANRAVGLFAGYLASAAGAWFVLGPLLGQLWQGGAGATGRPVGSQGLRVIEQLGFFSGLGVVILFLAAQAVGRFSVRAVRDVRAAEKHHHQKLEARRERAAAEHDGPGAGATPAAPDAGPRPGGPDSGSSGSHRSHRWSRTGRGH